MTYYSEIRCIARWKMCITHWLPKRAPLNWGLRSDDGISFDLLVEPHSDKMILLHCPSCVQIMLLDIISLT